jgi:hypothetical protein
MTRNHPHNPEENLNSRQYYKMIGVIHPSSWNWTAISAVATIALAGGTFWMALMTRRLARQALDETVNAHILAKAAEDQRDIASRNEYASRQPVFIPIIPHIDTDNRQAPYPVAGGTTIQKHVEASFVHIAPSNTVTVRIVLRNVGRGAGRILQEPEPVLVEAAIGAGMSAPAGPNPVVVGPGDIAEIWAIGKPTMSPSPVPPMLIRGFEPYVRVRFQYTDLTNTMITDCDILFQEIRDKELRAIDLKNSSPRPFPEDANLES